MSTTKTSMHGKSGAVDSSGPARKLLSFCLGKEEYGLDILAVREIIGLIDITPLPRTPPYVKGVINLRGRIIPVIELRTRFGLSAVDTTEETCIIVVDVPLDGVSEPRQMGVAVDSVREVLDIPVGNIEPPPEFGCQVPMDYITGIGKVKEKVVVILDVTKVLSPADRNTIAALRTGASAAEAVAA
jgi:purine-binding chemotaxis protein CheW